MSQAELLSPAPLSPSVSLHSGRPATTSLEVAKFFGKRHDGVLRDVRRICPETPEDFRVHNFVETFRTIPGPNNSERQETYFILYRDGFMLLVMGYTGKKALTMKLAYIEAFNRMEAELAASSRPLADDMVLPASPDRPSRRTDPERKQLTAIINTWVSMAPIHYANARAQVNAHFGVASVDALTVAQVREAIAWVQAKIDALPPVPELPAAEKLPLFRNGCFYSPGVNKNHVPGPREAALMDLWQTWGQQTAGLEKEFTGMMRELERRRGDLFAVAVSDLGRNADTAFSFESLMEGLFYTHNMALHYFKEAISLQRLSIRLSVNVAVALGR